MEGIGSKRLERAHKINLRNSRKNISGIRERNQLKVRFKRKNLCDGFINDCLNFADDSIYFYLYLGRMGSLLFQLALANQNILNELLGKRCSSS